MAVDREEALGLLQRDHAHNEDLTSSDKSASNDVALSHDIASDVLNYHRICLTDQEYDRIC